MKPKIKGYRRRRKDQKKWKQMVSLNTFWGKNGLGSKIVKKKQARMGILKYKKAKLKPF